MSEVERKNIVFVSNNLMICGLHAMKESGLISASNTVVFHGRKANPEHFSEFQNQVVKVGHSCVGWRKIPCLRKYIRYCIDSITEAVGHGEYNLYVPHTHHTIYEVAFLDKRCQSLSFLEEGSLSYHDKFLPEPKQVDPWSKLLYGQQMMKGKTYLPDEYKTAVGLSPKSFLWAADRRVELSLPTEIPGYEFKTDHETTLLAIPKHYFWGDKLDKAAVWKEKAKKKCEEIGLKTIIKPHPGQHSDVRLAQLKDDFSWAHSIDAKDEIIVELEVIKRNSVLVTQTNSLTDVLPNYGYQPQVLDF